MHDDHALVARRPSGLSRVRSAHRWVSATVLVTAAIGTVMIPASEAVAAAAVGFENSARGTRATRSGLENGHRLGHDHGHEDPHHRPSNATSADDPPAADSSQRPRFITDRPGLDLPLPGEDEAFTFAIFGDRTGGPAAGVSVLADAVSDVNLIGPDMVMTVGDLIEGYSGVGPWMEQMREFRGIMAELDCPWFPVAGNHDIYWRGPNRPAEEHERRYEEHFGPLWYAFRHKGSLFVSLYSDEANPRTGERNFNRADCQRMSAEQLAWLTETLAGHRDAEHVFVFIHHPRWTGGNYGDDWERVHQVLVDAGNVRAVFGGHIHRMRYDPRDGIEYVTLATVGGHQRSLSPDGGW
ncbi:MAG: metallophosphoesterase, partial [Phycisphaerales bacterium]